MLLQGNCVKRITASGGGDLQADAGESFLIRGLYCEPSTNDTFLTLRVDRKTVGVYRVKGRYGNHLSHIRRDYISMNLIEFLTRKGINVAIPVAEGQVFNVSRYAETGEVVIVYDIYEAGEINAGMPNGSDAKEFTFIQYMDAATYPSASGDTVINTALSPAEFPDFPCGAVVPAKKNIDILGLIGTPVGHKTDANNHILTTFVKLIKDRETLFDEDRNGIPFRASLPTFTDPEHRAAFSLIGGAGNWWLDGDFDTYGEPLIFDPTLNFVSGEELLIYLTFALTGTKTLGAASIDLATILHVTSE